MHAKQEDYDAERMRFTADQSIRNALHRTTQLLQEILPRLSPADAKTMGLVSAMISENERILGVSHE